MKKCRKSKTLQGLGALMLTLVMCLVMAVPAFALSPADKGEIVVNGAEDGLKVSAYRLMDIKLDADGNPQDPVYSWTTEMQAWVDVNFNQYSDVDNFNSNDVNDTNGLAKAFYDKLAAAIRDGSLTFTEPAITATTASGTASLQGVMGNYLILVENGMKIYSPSAVNLVPEYVEGQWKMTSPAQVNLKSTEPMVDKEITDADYQKGIGDTVPYKVTADVPHYPVNKTITPVFKISDTLSAGLTFNNDLVVKADGNMLVANTDYTVNTVAGKAFEIEFIYDQVAAADKVTVEYSATVNADAVVGDAANPNRATLEYSNNPYIQDTSKEKTDEEKVYTYGMKVTKVKKGTTEGLAGAEFTLSKGGNTIKFTEAGGEYVVDLGGVVETLVTDANGKLNIKGLDVGDYLLTETKAPAGYNKLKDPITVTIKDVDVNGKVENIESTEIESGYVELNVENSQGVELPVTGGMGTILFTAGGILLIGGALVLLLIARRKRNMAA